MIPPFDNNGYLLPGIHLATLNEIEARFGRGSEIRRVQFESLVWLVELARLTGILRIVINGSYVTQVREPNDVDCAILTGPDFPRDAAAGAEIDTGLLFLQLSIGSQKVFDRMVEYIYASDRKFVPKGVVEILL